MKAKINPLEQLIAIYGTKFHEALKAGNVTKAIRMCADYQSPDRGDVLTFPDRVKAFAFRVSMEALKVPEIARPAIVIRFNPEQTYMLMRDRDFGTMMMFDNRFQQDGEFEFMNVLMKRVYE